MHATRVSGALAAVIGMAAIAHAQPGTGFTISDGNTFFTQGVSPSGAAGPTGAGAGGAAFRVTGAAGTDHLFQNWWWYRINGTDIREFALANAIGTTVSGSMATTNWTYPQFTVQLVYRVQAAGASAGRLFETLTLTNTGSVPLSITVFNYTDFDLNASATSDSAALGMGPSTIRITEGSTFAEFEAPGANFYAVTGFATLRNSLADADIDNFNNTGLPFGPGDFTGGFQWNLMIAPASTATMLGELRVNVGGSFGACCVPGAACQVANPAYCTLLSGTYSGDNTTCSPDPCAPMAMGACCMGRCGCTQLTQAACVAAGGTYQGDGTPCGGFGCFPQPSCPCNWNGDNFLNSQDFFDFLSAFFEVQADYNCDGFVNSQDFFDFSACLFTPPVGCN